MNATHDLKNKIIVIAGASSGFGRGAAVKLAEAGANVVIAARRSDVLDEVVAEIRDADGSAVAVEADVSSSADVETLARTAIERFGAIDVWVNNVGIGALGLFWDIPLDDHARVVDVNLTGLINGAHVALRHFLEQGKGVLINVGSIDSEVPLAYQSSYAATKAGVLSLSRSLNEELRIVGAAETIRVGTIMPWAVDTPWWTHAANYSGHAPRMAAMDDPQLVVDAIVDACTDPREEQKVGWKARGSNASHHIFPGLTERFSAGVAHRETQKGTPVAATSGSIHRSRADGLASDGGIRARMEAEDAARKGE